MKCCYYVIPLPPVGKKNSQEIYVNSKTGRPFISQSQRYKKYAKECGLFLNPKPSKPIDYPVNIRALFYMPTKRRVDTVNLQEALWDILVEHGVLADDNRDIIASSDGSRTYYDKSSPRTVVYIEPLDEEYERFKE